MYKNFQKDNPGDHLMELSWGAARAWKESEFDRVMSIIEKDDKPAFEWLQKESKTCWARAFFDTTSKCDALTNNFSESFNKWILKLRDKPLVQFVDKYSLMVMQLLYNRRLNGLEMEIGGLVPTAMSVIEKLERKYNRYTVQGVIGSIWLAMNIKSGRKFNVDLDAHTCTCMVWQITGLPCVHAIAVIRPRREPWVK